MVSKRISGGKPVGLPLADLLYLRRKQMRLTQEELAEQLRKQAASSGSRSGATAQLIHRYEMGTIPHLKSLNWLASSLNLSPEMVSARAKWQRAQIADPFPSPSVDEKRKEIEVEVDTERIQATMQGSSQIDKQSLEQLAFMTESFMQQSWSATPQSLLPAVIGHLYGFGNILLRVPPTLSSHTYSMAGEVALLVGYLSLKSGLVREASSFWQVSKRMALNARNKSLQGTLLILQSWKARDEGQLEQALKSSNLAQSLLRKNSAPTVAALTYSNRAYDLATVGRNQAANKDLENAEKYLRQLSGDDQGFYILERIRDEVETARGWNLFHLKQYVEAAHIFEQILTRVDSTWKAYKAIILAHLGAIYAQQGESKQAIQTFDSAFLLAREARAARYEQRIQWMRQQWLFNR